MMTFNNAKKSYIMRYTMEHVPAWAARPCAGNGKFYAPQYRTDREWFENTLFGKDKPFNKRTSDCYSTNASWPLGEWLDAPFQLGAK